MPTYTVHAPPLRRGETKSSPERFLFVRDGFYVWAFLAAPLWLLLHRLWLALIIYLLGCALVGVGLVTLQASSNTHLLIGFLIALLIGFEASTIWRWTLARRRWTTLGFVIGEDAEMAERRFFGEWSKHTSSAMANSDSSPEPKHATPVRRSPPPQSDIIGLFPEPGSQR
jgi:hypothetical protein